MKIKNRISITELPKEAKVRKTIKSSFDYGSKGKEEGEVFFIHTSKINPRPFGFFLFCRQGIIN